MTKTRKNYAMRISALLLVLTMTSLCMVSGTFAKYTTTVETSPDTARVARFAFKLNDQNPFSEKYFLWSLFSTVYDGGTVAGTQQEFDDRVARNLVAPGLSWRSSFILTNTGNVAITVTPTIEEVSNPGNIPLQYAITNNEYITAAELEPLWTTPEKAFQQLTPVTLGVDNEYVATPNESKQYVHWRWDPNSSDEDDTNLGTASTLAEVTLKVTLQAEQVLPTSSTQP